VLTFIARRLLLLFPTMLLLSFVVFALSLVLNPEAAAITRAGGADAPSRKAIEQARAELHLDDPWFSRYLAWLGDAVQFDFGRSFVRLEPVPGTDGTAVAGVSVATSIKQVFPRTLSLVLVSGVFILVIGVPIGIIGGVRPGSLVDRLTGVVTTAGLAIPSFFVGMLLVSWLAVGLRVLPAIGYVSISEGGAWEWFRHLILPGIALSLAPAAVVARQMRAGMAEVMGQTYIRTAWAKGASLLRVVMHHAMRNAASAPLTVFGLMMLSLLGGTVIIETLFAIDGVGNLVVQSVRSTDVPMLQGIVLFFIVLNVVMNLVIDIVYGYLNPKVRIR
jgi:peptide/nickel transport system permease protein